jgi:hypothetical protein
MHEKEMLAVVEERAVAALGISFQLVLDTNGARTITFQTHVPVDLSDQRLNDLLDKVVRATQRQTDLVKIEELKVEIEMLDKSLFLHQGDLADLLQKQAEAWYSSDKRGDWSENRMPAPEQSKAHTLRVNIKGLTDRAAHARKRLAELEERHSPRSNGHASADGSADRDQGVSDR